jgi:ParB-like chromosome segregation protein Spo0J
VNVSTCQLSEISLNSEYLRLETDVTALKKSIESVGLIHPLTINQDKALLAGARRFQAVSELGWEEVPVQVVERDALASEAVKRARSEGGLNTTKTNEIIKLEKDTREKVLPLIADKTAKETRRIVAAARTGGLPAALEEAQKVVPLPREHFQMVASRTGSKDGGSQKPAHPGGGEPRDLSALASDSDAVV